MSETCLPPLGRHPPCSMVKSQIDPNASTTVLIGLATRSAAAFDLNLSRCQKSGPGGSDGKSLRDSRKAGPVSSVVPHARVVA